MDGVPADQAASNWARYTIAESTWAAMIDGDCARYVVELGDEQAGPPHRLKERIGRRYAAARTRIDDITVAVAVREYRRSRLSFAWLRTWHTAPAATPTS
jgi:hypothetical protein